MLRRFVRYWVGKAVARPLHRKFAAFEAACQDPRADAGGPAPPHPRVPRRHRLRPRPPLRGDPHRRRLPPARAGRPLRVRRAVHRPGACAARRRPCSPTAAVLMFALTSGTTAARKLIPVTDAVPRRLPPRVEHVGPEDATATTAAGVPAADRAAVRRPRRVPHRGRHPVRQPVRVHREGAEAAHPVDVLRPAGHRARSRTPRARYYVALRFALPRRVGMFMAANPSTLVNLARHWTARRNHLHPRPARRHAEQRPRHAGRHPGVRSPRS